MARALFVHPIYLRDKHFIQEITSLDDAFDFLEEWPEERRDLIYEMAVKACREAYCGRFPLEAAEKTLRRFAQKAGILSDVEDVPVWRTRTTDRNLSGR
jgi:hypothetical protein